jgi:hypothetical protein
MILCRKPEETLNDFKQRLIEEVETDRLSAEDAFDAFEEAYLKEVENDN